MAGYGASRGAIQIIGGFWVYAGILEYLPHFSPGRHRSPISRHLGNPRRREAGSSENKTPVLICIEVTNQTDVPDAFANDHPSARLPDSASRLPQLQ
jgi:hypothetical protein